MRRESKAAKIHDAKCRLDAAVSTLLEKVEMLATSGNGIDSRQWQRRAVFGAARAYGDAVDKLTRIR